VGDRRAAYGERVAALPAGPDGLHLVAAGVAVAEVAAQAQPGLLLAGPAQRDGKAHAGGGQVGACRGRIDVERGRVTLFGEPVGVQLHVRVLQVGLERPGTGVEPPAGLDEALPRIRVVAGERGVAEALGGHAALGVHVVAGMAHARAQAHGAPGPAGVDAKVHAVGLQPGIAIAYRRIGAPGAAERAHPPAGEVVVDADEHVAGARLHAGGVAVAGDVATLPVDVDPGARGGVAVALGGERILAVRGARQRGVADHTAAVE